MNNDNEPAHQPAYTRPIPAKPVPKKSPGLSNADMSRDAVIGLQASSRRIKLTQTLDIFLRHNPDSLDIAEAFVESLTSGA